MQRRVRGLTTNAPVDLSSLLTRGGVALARTRQSADTMRPSNAGFRIRRSG
jgi:hypothetical protein